jgi:hypothetical protein
MFKLALTVLILFTASSVFANELTEIRVLENFDPQTKTYTGTIRSTPMHPISMAALLNDLNGVCYKGDYAQVLVLLLVMAEIYNTEQAEMVLSRPILTALENRPNGPIALRFKYKSRFDESIAGVWEWHKVPVCVR